MRRYRYFQVNITLGSELLLWPKNKYVKTRGLFALKRLVYKFRVITFALSISLDLVSTAENWSYII